MNEIRGSIQITIDESELLADIIFTPDPQGDEWDVKALNRFLGQNGIVAGVTSQKIQEALSLFSSAQTPLSYKIAQGVAVELPTPDVYQWEELSIPEEKIKDSQACFEANSMPDIRQERVRKVKKKKKIVKKPKLPFMPVKEELVEVVEKENFLERVYVNSHIEARGWVNDGDKLAVIIAGRPGKPGRSVKGKPIPLPADSAGGFYLGEGLVKKGYTVWATQAGFFRRGENWAEVLSFDFHQWELSLSKDRSTCYITVTPGAPEASVPSPEQLAAAIEKSGVPKDTILSPGEILEIFNQAIENATPLEKVSISHDDNADIKIVVSPDRLKATLTLRKGRGKGKALNLKEIGETIRAKGLKGMKNEQVKKDILDFYKGSELELADYLLVEGRAPGKGEDQTIELLVSFMKEEKREKLRERLEDLVSEELRHESLEEFPVAFVEEIASVKKDQPLAQISVLKKGEDGIDVLGNKIEGLYGKELKINVYENIRLEKSVYVADRQGILEKGLVGDSLAFRIRPYLDSRVEVTLSPDRMEGYLSLVKEQGVGNPLTLEDIREKIADAKVIKEIDEKALQEAFDKAASGEVVNKFLFARGKAPSIIGGTTFNLKIKIASGIGVTIDKKGKANYKSQDRITVVNEGDFIAEILEPQNEGEDGWDVTGLKLSVKKAGNLNLEIGQHIRQEAAAEGATRLFAATSGELFYNNKKIEVLDIYTVQGDVGLKSGNIKFPGSVKVSGSVQSGFYVYSGGTVTIGEGVEAALVSSDGDIIVQQGIKGGGKAVVRAKKNIEVSFAEQATLLSVQDIYIKNSCFRCVVKCNGKMVLEGKKGSLIGGTIKARKGLDVLNLGSEGSGGAEVFFGQDYLVEDQIMVEEKQIKGIHQKLVKLDAALRKIDHMGDKEKADQIRQEKLKNLKLLEKRKIRLFTLREKFESHVPSEIRVRGTVYPGVVLHSHGRSHQIIAKKKSVLFSFNVEKGFIEEKPLK